MLSISFLSFACSLQHFPCCYNNLHDLLLKCLLNTELCDCSIINPFSAFRMHLFIIVVQLPSCVQLFVTPWIAACRATPPLHPSPFPKVYQVHVHCIGDAIQPSHPLIPSSLSALNHSQHQGLFQ